MSVDLMPEWRIERNKALAAMDLSPMGYLAAAMPGASPEVLEMSAHKARYECTDLAPTLRLESGEWLRARGLGRMHGPLLPPGQLPA